eukprot:370054-Rhodomonas_salina.4
MWSASSTAHPRQPPRTLAGLLGVQRQARTSALMHEPGGNGVAGHDEALAFAARVPGAVLVLGAVSYTHLTLPTICSV